MKKQLFTSLIFINVVMVSALLFGLVQNHLSEPTRGCKKFDASSKFYGFRCADKTLYMSK